MNENIETKQENIDSQPEPSSNISEDESLSINLNPNFDFHKHIDITDIKEEADKFSKTVNNSGQRIGMLLVNSANSWIELAKNRPIPKMLFSELWFEGEICILFADSNLGKSILAVQIGDSISTGVEIKGFKLEAPKQTVLYFDFELSDKQFENRYSSNYDNHYSFNDDFLRIEIDPDATIPEGQDFEDFLAYSMEQSIINTNAKVLIIDNLTYLRNDNEKAKDALPLMKHLKALKNKYSLSILALSHTQKEIKQNLLQKNDLQGSKMLINFCDSSFAIGESQSDSHIRYIKQIKPRNTEAIFDGDNVCLCEIKKSFNFVQFELIGYGAEMEHLKQKSHKGNEQSLMEVMELKNEGLSNVEIGRRFNVSEAAIRKRLKKIEHTESEK